MADENFFRPVPGLDEFALKTHGFTVGYLRTLLRSFKCDSGKDYIFKKGGGMI